MYQEDELDLKRAYELPSYFPSTPYPEEIAPVPTAQGQWVRHGSARSHPPGSRGRSSRLQGTGSGDDQCLSTCTVGPGTVLGLN